MLLLVICSFHEDTRGSVVVKGMCLDSFTVRNWVQQGCTMAPVLFNLYFCARAMVDGWRCQCRRMFGCLHPFIFANRLLLNGVLMLLLFCPLCCREQKFGLLKLLR